jgi:hypothetical protein
MCPSLGGGKKSQLRFVQLNYRRIGEFKRRKRERLWECTSNLKRRFFI